MRRTGLLVVGLLLTLTACGGGSDASPPPSPTSPSSTSAPTPVTSTTLPATTTTATPAFSATVETVTAADLGASWHDGCPVGPADLRRVRLTYWGFDNAPHAGVLIVHVSVVDEIRQAFAALYAARFPIRSMQPVDVYGASDDNSMAADNTSAFNCRLAVTSGPAGWSVHAFGQAIDINPVENPYLEGGRVLPPAGSTFTDRASVRAGMAVPGNALNTAFAAVGWQWGGRWSANPDYQHFSKTGG